MNKTQRQNAIKNFSKVLKIKKLTSIELITLFNLQGEIDTLLKSYVLPLVKQ